MVGVLLARLHRPAHARDAYEVLAFFDFNPGELAKVLEGLQALQLLVAVNCGRKLVALHLEGLEALLRVAQIVAALRVFEHQPEIAPRTAIGGPFVADSVGRLVILALELVDHLLFGQYVAVAVVGEGYVNGKHQRVHHHQQHQQQAGGEPAQRIEPVVEEYPVDQRRDDEQDNGGHSRAIGYQPVGKPQGYSIYQYQTEQAQ